MVKKISKVIIIVVLLVLIINIVIPSVHKEVGDAYKNHISQIEFESDSVCTEKVLSIEGNEEALLWRLRMIAAARESITMATFDLRADETGTDIIAALYNAAQRGVRVRLLIDGIYEKFFLRDSNVFRALCAHKNIEARVYNPIQLKNIFNINYRMHDKYLMVDERMYLLGGRNTNDIFLGKLHEGANIDRDILVYNTEAAKGKSYQQLEKYFVQIWNESCVREVQNRLSKEDIDAAYIFLGERYRMLIGQYGDFGNYDKWEEDTFDADQITLVSNETHAGNKEPRVLYSIERLTVHRDKVFIQTPYVICDDYMYQVLKHIEEESEIEMIINSVEKGSNPWGCTDYLNNKDRILETGTDVYELMNEYAVHTKTVLLDDNIAIVGSYNLDMRSTYLDTELMLVIDSAQLNSHIKERFEQYKEKSLGALADGTEIKGNLYQKRELTSKKRIFYGVLRILIKPFRHLL